MGRLLVDRMLQSRCLDPADVTPLERLAIVGDSGMGALTYRPTWNVHADIRLGDLDELASKCHALLNREDVQNLDEVFHMGGSSGGARPKVMTNEWIVKFPASGDMKDTGLMEKEYTDHAAACGIIVPETKLLPSQQCSDYFAVRRFDRKQTTQGVIPHHVLTAAAILEIDGRNAALDYHTLMKHNLRSSFLQQVLNNASFSFGHRSRLVVLFLLARHKYGLHDNFYLIIKAAFLCFLQTFFHELVLLACSESRTCVSNASCPLQSRI